MRNSMFFVILIIFLLTSCAPVQLPPTPTMIPTHTATATSLPTATRVPATATQIPPATLEPQIEPSAEILNQILLEAGISFSPDTTNEILDENGNEVCTLGYSNGVLKNSQINYIQYPDSIKDYMCYNIWAKTMMLQRTNAPYLTKEFDRYPILASEQSMEIQKEMRDSAKNILNEHTQIPFTFWNLDSKAFTNDISGIELNHISKDEYLRLIEGLDKNLMDYLTFPPYELTEEDKAWNVQEADMLLFVKDKKLMVYAYNFGGRLDNAPGGITDPRLGKTALEQLRPKEREYMYGSLIEDYALFCLYMKILEVPDDKLGTRQGEIIGVSESQDNVFGVNDAEDKANADQTLSALYKPTPTVTP